MGKITQLYRFKQGTTLAEAVKVVISARNFVDKYVPKTGTIHV